MGPITLFDKSFLQGLSIDESVWFDHFFYPVVCPMFYVETLADLEKALRLGRTPEQEVGSIAAKTPQLHIAPCANHQDMVINSLMGLPIPMTGQIPVAGERPVRVDGKLGAVWEESPESKAFARWQRGEFLELERSYAKSWRQSLADLNLRAVADGIAAVHADACSCRSLAETKAFADHLISDKLDPFAQLRLASIALNLPAELAEEAIQRWLSMGAPPLHQYAPYAAHVLTVGAFFQVALASSLISTDRPSNRNDVGYLFYLPFCSLFVSSDKLHRESAQQFVREDQEFVWGPDLKADLKALNERYSHLPEKEREKGMMRFAPRPVETESSLVRKLWQRHTPRGLTDLSESKQQAADPELLDRLKRFQDSPVEPIDTEQSLDLEMVSIKRMVQAKRGSWWQVPRDVVNKKPA